MGILGFADLGFRDSGSEGSGFGVLVKDFH